MLAAKKVEVFARNSEGLHVMKQMRWGLIPPAYAPAPDLYDGSTYHARLETVHEKPAFQESWRKKWRCLFPMEFFRQKLNTGNDLFGRQSKGAQVAISRADGAPLGVAGIYSAIRTPEGLILSAAILTREPGPLMAKIHDREPVVIEPGDFAAWLDGSDALDLMSPWADDAFVCRLETKGRPQLRHQRLPDAGLFASVTGEAVGGMPYSSP